MTKKLLHKRFVIIFICITALTATVIVFAWQATRTTPTYLNAEEANNYSASVEVPYYYEYEAPHIITPTIDIQVANLQKLCKVWGFTKYTHLVFLTGERCWDEELFYLIPIIQFADPEDVNDILYNWFISLGDDGYDLDWEAYRAMLLDRWADTPDYYNLIIDFFDTRDYIGWQDIWDIENQMWYLTSGYEMNPRQMANLSWINKEYIGFAMTSPNCRIIAILLLPVDTSIPIAFII